MWPFDRKERDQEREDNKREHELDSKIKYYGSTSTPDITQDEMNELQNIHSRQKERNKNK